MTSKAINQCTSSCLRPTSVCMYIYSSRVCGVYDLFEDPSVNSTTELMILISNALHIVDLEAIFLMSLQMNFSTILRFILMNIFLANYTLILGSTISFKCFFFSIELILFFAVFPLESFRIDSW